MSAMTSGRIVQPKPDHKIAADGTGLVYFAKTRSRARVRLAEWLVLPLIVIGGVAVAGALGTPDNTGGLLVALGWWALLIALIVWASSDKTVRIGFDEKAITVRGRSYLLEHVSDIRWRSSGSYVAFGNFNVLAAAARDYRLSGVVFLRYGGKEIPLVKGLHPDKVEAVYGDIQRFLKTVGRP